MSLYAQRIEEATESLKNSLREVFASEYESFITALKNSKAIISGGFVLRHLLFEDIDNFEDQDIDIYFNIKNSKEITRKIIFDEENSIHRAYFDYMSNTEGYCESFLSKNKITRVIKIEGLKFKDSQKLSNIDLMYVRNSQPLETVVKNFDLSCCMNYFDGEKIHILGNEKDLFEKKMTLSPDYIENMLNGNKFTISRIKKYISRGFYLQISSPFKLEAISQTKRKNFDPCKYIQFCIFCIVFDRNYDISSGIDNDTHKVSYLINTLHNLLSLPEETNSTTSSWNGDSRGTRLTLRDISAENFDKLSVEKILKNDSYDSEEFSTLQDYKNLNLDDVAIRSAKKLINVFRILKEFEHSKDIIKYLNRFLNMTTTADFSKFSNLECFDEVNQESYKIQNYLNSPENIIIRYNDKYSGYNRAQIYKYLKENIQKMEPFFVSSFYDGRRILNIDVTKIGTLSDIRLFSLVSSGFKLEDLEIYTLIPYENVDKFLSI